jgi:carbon-monoxide dehydrogenase medium subunit
MKRSNGHVADVQIGLTAVNPAPMLVKGVQQLLRGKAVDDQLADAAAELAAKTAKPLTTSALTPEYRREMIRVFTKRVLLEISGQ